MRLLHKRGLSHIVVCLSIILLIVQMLCIPVSGEDTEKTSDKTDTKLEADSKVPDYTEYKKMYQSAETVYDETVIEADSYKKTDGAPVFESRNDYKGKPGVSVLLPDSGEVTFQFSVNKTGLYNLSFLYYTGENSGNSVIRDILIDGVLPFAQSAEVSFEQVWENKNGDKTVFDSLGNEIRSKQVLKHTWNEKAAMDSGGYYTEPFDYYLTSGVHTLTLIARRESMLLRSIKLYHEKNILSYEEIKQEYVKNGYKTVPEDASLTIEAEFASSKSDQTMYSLSDRTSPSVSPYSYDKIRYNTIGGLQWQTAGQWLEWNIDVKTSGLYNIAAHFKQSLKVNDISIRELYIDGSLPFKECADLTFYYSTIWQTDCFGDKNKTPYQFYLTKGPHIIRLRAGLGSFSEILTSVKANLVEMNRIYRKIVVITGTSPDQYRDYEFDKQIPDVLSDMKTLSVELKKLEERIKSLNKSGGQSTANLKRLYIQLDRMTRDPETIAYSLTNFKDNISSYGTWMNDLLKEPLELDTLMLKPSGAVLPRGEASFAGLFKHYALQFFSSFFTDYASVGVTNKDNTTTIKVWTISGRDQSQILKQMINDTFTDEKSVAVDLQLVSSAALLPAIVAGVGPDIYMGLTQAEPVNMALRNALLDVSKFDDFNEVKKRFYEQAMVPFELEGGVYALPDTMSFPMLFYRKDILEELHISTNSLNSWDSLLNDVLPELQVNSLSVGILASIQNYIAFLYQQGGNLYLDGGRKSGLNTPMAIAAMEKYSMLYNQYGLLLSFDFANRFRTGDMPVCVADFMMYNQLTVFAPEIKGLWGMLPIPGTVGMDGKINHTAVATITGSAILSRSKHPKESWEFLKWWSSTETQAEYGNSLESVVGSAARYNSANVEAMSNVQWDYDIKQNLLSQLKEVKAYPEVPGGYLTLRHYDFAFRDIVYTDQDIRQTMSDAVDHINQEIKNKRTEYHLK